MSMYIDSHCHLSAMPLLPEVNGILKEMHEAKVKQALCVSTSLADFEEIKRLVDLYPQLWASVGVHPNNAKDEVLTVDDLLAGSQHPKVIAIGETGLDYYRQDASSRESIQWQHDRFSVHIQAAQATQLPLIIHTRNSALDTLEILKKVDPQGGSIAGVFHCFTENVDIAKQVLDLGFYLSFSGILTFNSAKELKEVARYVPHDRCLIETDSPYLAPTPYRGKVNTPAYVPYVAQALAKEWGKDVEYVGRCTSENFHSLFSKSAS